MIKKRRPAPHTHTTTTPLLFKEPACHAMLRARHMKSCVLMWDGWLEESKQDGSSLTLNHWLCPLLCSSPLAEQRVYSAAFGSDQRWGGLAHSRSFNCNHLRMPRTFSPDENISSAVCSFPTPCSVISS